MEVALNQHTTSSDDSSSDSEAEVAGLKVRKPRRQFTGGNVSGKTTADSGDGEPSENSAYLDKYGGAIEDLNIREVFNSVASDANRNGETEAEIVTESAINGGGDVIEGKSEQIEEEIVEEEVVELEFEKAIPKLHTHTMHCPNCDHQITKVVLRRKTIIRRPPVTVKRDEPLDLLGCFSCFSLFTSTDGGFNPFHIFGNNPTSSVVPQADRNGVVREDGNCFSIFRVFRREKDSKQSEPNVGQDPEQPNPVQVDIDFEQQKPGKPDYPSPPPTEINDVLNKLPILRGENYVPDVEGGPSKGESQPPASSVPSHHDPPHTGVTIDIPPGTSIEIQVPPQGSETQDSTSFEILKSIVYGGLMEVIASLSIVASAAAGDATTLSIIALALANLIGGVFVIGHNLWDLRDDCFKFSTQQASNQESLNKYKELLGSVEHFPLHAFFAILSFLVFGIIPPLAYGYSFHETNDKDFTMVIVAVASLVCVGLLAIFRAYIDRCTGFAGYVKTVTYYLTTAVAASGVSYVVGNLVTRLIEELGLFETSSNVSMAVLPEVLSTNPSLAYY